MESEEVRGEAAVYAYESGEEETGCSSQGLALEQFFVLREKRLRFDSHRFCELILILKSKSPAFKNQKTGAPRIQSQRPGHPPGFQDKQEARDLPPPAPPKQ